MRSKVQNVFPLDGFSRATGLFFTYHLPRKVMGTACKYLPVLPIFFLFYPHLGPFFIAFRERKGEREKHWCEGSISWLCLVRAWTWDWTRNLSAIGQCSNPATPVQATCLFLINRPHMFIWEENVSSVEFAVHHLVGVGVLDKEEYKGVTQALFVCYFVFVFNFCIYRGSWISKLSPRWRWYKRQGAGGPQASWE